MAGLSEERIGHISITASRGLKDCHHPRNNQQPSKKWVFSHPVPQVFLGRKREKEMKYLSTRMDENLILGGDLTTSMVLPGKERQGFLSGP